MKVKTITGWTEKTLDDKVNDFLSNGSIDIVDIKYSSTIFYFSAMVIYKGGNIQSS
ncbi:sporulation protein Cse60 [Bacillus lacus]|uniref:Sporulation protein Cse60 n=1 Tax=Metabacillus lacus TaxID=1983721 RepID=A0A7X2LZ02_9BACI|nr:sporulation protein Cse60 [Metabacillus lacus]MRX74120.1 sporulation protein Cse60 [Metabacillus lacus]